MTRALLAWLCLASGAAVAAPPSAAEPHHTIVAHLSAGGRLQVTDTVRVAGRTRFVFRLANWLDIKALHLDGQPVQLRRSDHGHAVLLPDSGLHTLVFELQGTVPSRGTSRRTAGDGQSSRGEDGTYLPGFSAWVPVDGDALLTYHLTISVPAGQRAVATGTLLDELDDGERYEASFAAPRATGPPSVFAGPYTVRERQHDGLRIRTYFHDSLTDLADAYLTSARTYIDRYAVTIGDYPYSDFHIVSAPLPVGLGFPNLTYVGRRVLPLPFMRTRSLAHEILHNWWGNGVSVDYASGNWSEGLTTFMADYALAEDQGEAAARAMREQWLRDYAALPAERDQAVRAFRAKRHQASQVIGYNKVAFIFHMLRQLIGAQAFNEGIREFWSRHASRTAGWSDLQAAFEHSAGHELDGFFEQWLSRSGAPRLWLGKHSTQRSAQGFRTRIELQQASPPYRLRVPVRLATTAGVEAHTVDLTGTATTLTFDTAARPLSVHADPDSDVFRRLPIAETPPIMRDVTLHPAAITVVTTRDPAFRTIARELAARLMDTAPRFDDLAAAQAANVPVLLVTDAESAADQLEQLQIETRRPLPEVPHSAAAWTLRRVNGAPVLIVTAPDAPALQSLLRPLPHYGSRSYVLFDDHTAVRKGVWPITPGQLYRTFAAAG